MDRRRRGASPCPAPHSVAAFGPEDAVTDPAQQLARSADRLFVQTEGERQMLLDRGFAPEKLVLQGMGVDVAACTGGDRLRTRAEWGAGPDEMVVGHLANNSREKGSVDLLQAAT